MVDRAGAKPISKLSATNRGSQELIELFVDRKDVAHVSGVLEKTTLLAKGLLSTKGARALYGVDSSATWS